MHSEALILTGPVSHSSISQSAVLSTDDLAHLTGCLVVNSHADIVISYPVMLPSSWDIIISSTMRTFFKSINQRKLLYVTWQFMKSKMNSVVGGNLT